MRRLLLLTLIAMLTLVVYAPTALAQDDTFQRSLEAAERAAEQNAMEAAFGAQQGAPTPSAQGGAPASGATQMPNTGGPALLPIAGALLLLGGSIGLGASVKRRFRL